MRLCFTDLFLPHRLQLLHRVLSRPRASSLNLEVMDKSREAVLGHPPGASAGLRGIARRTSGRSKSTKAIENRSPSADKTDGKPQASIP